MSVVLKLVWIFLMVIFKKTLILFGRQQTVNLNNTITKMPEARKKKKTNTTPPSFEPKDKGEMALLFGDDDAIISETKLLGWENLLTDRNIPILVTLFHFSVIPLPCFRYYNHCKLFYILLYCESDNKCYIPTELLLWSILLLVWYTVSNYSYKAESWQAWQKMDAKVRLSIV